MTPDQIRLHQLEAEVAILRVVSSECRALKEENARLRAALEEIANPSEKMSDTDATLRNRMQRIARAALEEK